jgi:hypothetical protein
MSPHKCKNCPWFTYSDHTPPKDESLGICKYFHALRKGGTDCTADDYSKVEEAWLVFIEGETPEDLAT